MKPLRIIIADDYELFREGLQLLLRKNRRYNVVAEAADGRELLEMAATHQADVIITDVQMPDMDGIEATRQIRAQDDKIKIIALTMFEEEQLIVDMMEAGANGYLVKKAGKAELYTAINQVMEGRVYYCDYTSHNLSRMLAASKKLSRQTEDLARFSKKELEIIQLICREYASKEIASVTHLAHRTVEKYRERIMEKTGAQNMVGIVVYAIRNGLFKL
jgi:DNA-binding NarL/FixJ family response regulator